MEATHSSAPAVPARTESTSLQFADAARRLGEVAQRAGVSVPAFRSPPRVVGRRRTIRRRRDGSCTVSVVLRNRPWVAVLADMVDGVIVANPTLDAGRAEELRDALWEAVAPDRAANLSSAA